MKIKERAFPFDHGGEEKIGIKRRTKAEIESYQEGFRAGVQMCLTAINDNYAKYKEMVGDVVATMMLESEE